jgi:hypothetical protein
MTDTRADADADILHASSTGEAYNLSNCDERWATGTVFVVESERVVGVAWAWPLAVTAERGALHSTGHHPSQWTDDPDIPVLAKGADLAIAEARRRGWALAPWAAAP